MDDLERFIPDKMLESNIIRKIKKKKLISRYITLVFALLILSLVFNIFLVSTNIVSGGLNGIAIIFKNLYKVDPSVVIFVISIILLIISFIFLGVERTAGSIVSTFLYPLLVKLTSYIAKFIVVDTGDLILISIFVGVIGGFANGLIYRTGFSNGGLPIISQILYDKFKIPPGKSSLVINGIIVFIGGLFFGWTMVMYALIILYINSFILEKVILGVSNKKAFYIITNKDSKIKKYIIENLKHSVTVFDVKGGFFGKKDYLLLTVVPTREYFSVAEGIKEIDPNAFFLVCDAYEVKGGK